MNKTYNLYCDESCHLENDKKSTMFLGYTSIAYNQVRGITERINDLKDKHHFRGEIKWSRVSMSQYRFYEDLIKYFFETEMTFRCIGIDKAQINIGKYNKTYDDFYYTMYYSLLNYKIDTFCKYNVYLDIKDSLSANKVNYLKNILNIKFGVFRNVQNMRSHESLIMQVTDLMMGAISYKHNNIEKANIAKVKLIEKITTLSNVSLDRTNNSNKLNLFFIELS
ncbi:DUF3800 domain-containing protein [Chryseobacterium sp. SIMBA_038]|uniref:DUF3800 domain-containing protein n=1 Tax=Chryseobacterium sp. SIMBA_038 TaxID=3085780 RepID=UPI0039792E9C